MTTTHTPSADTASAVSPAAARAARRYLVGLDPPARKPVIVPVDSILGEDLPLYTGPKVRAS